MYRKRVGEDAGSLACGEEPKQRQLLINGVNYVLLIFDISAASTESTIVADGTAHPISKPGVNQYEAHAILHSVS